MSQESWLFLFALCGALGGAAAFCDLVWKLWSTRETAGPMSISRTRVWITAVLLLVSLGLSIAGFVTIYAKNRQSMLPRTIEWGAIPDPSRQRIAGCQVTTDTTLILPLAEKYDVVLICGVADPAIDALEDTRIAVSNPFSITGGNQVIADIFKNADLLEAVKTPPIAMWQKVVVIPKGTDLSKIRRVSDVPRFGGKIFP